MDGGWRCANLLCGLETAGMMPWTEREWNFNALELTSQCEPRSTLVSALTSKLAGLCSQNLRGTCGELSFVSVAVVVTIHSVEECCYRQVVGLEVVGPVDELDELEAGVLAPSLVGRRCCHVVQMEALVHLPNSKESRGRVMACGRKPRALCYGWR